MLHTWLLGALVLVLLLAAPALTEASPPTVAGCSVFPADNAWNTRIDALPVHPLSSAWVESVGRDKPLHPDFGAGLWDGGPIGIPFDVVSSQTPRTYVEFEYADESEPGLYPIPTNPSIEWGPQATGDRHILVLDQDTCMLFELFNAYPTTDGGWKAGSGAIFDLSSNQLRPDGWTSADAAGLPILPGLIRYDEVAAGEITHAIRFTAPQTSRSYLWPARHFASRSSDPALPPMGARFRLRADYDITPYPRDIQVILKALQTYGIILADNGSSWFISGAPDPRWNNTRLRMLRDVKGDDFEAVDASGLQVAPDSGQVAAQ